MALGIGVKPPPGRVEGQLLADAEQHVGQGTPFGRVHQDVVGGEEPGSRAARQGGAGREPSPETRPVEMGGREPHPARRRLDQGPHDIVADRGGGRPVLVPGRAFHHDQLQTPDAIEEVRQGEVAATLLGALVAEREEAGQAAIGFAVLRIGQDVGRAVGEDEPRPDHDAEIRLGRNPLLGEAIGPHDPGQRVAVRDADAGEPERMGLGHQFLRMGGAAQKGEIGRDGQFGEACHGAPAARRPHPKRPCRNQRGSAVSRPNRPSR